MPEPKIPKKLVIDHRDGVTIDGEPYPLLVADRPLNIEHDGGLTVVYLPVIAEQVQIVSALAEPEQPKMTQAEAREVLARHNQRTEEPSA